MAINHADPAQLIQLLGASAPAAGKTATLFKTSRLEVIRMVLPAGKKIAPHAVEHEVVVQCLEGKVLFVAREKQQTLEPGTLLYLLGGDLHALEAVEDATLLVTIVLPG